MQFMYLKELETCLRANGATEIREMNRSLATRPANGATEIREMNRSLATRPTFIVHSQSPPPDIHVPRKEDNKRVWRSLIF